MFFLYFKSCKKVIECPDMSPHLSLKSVYSNLKFLANQNLYLRVEANDNKIRFNNSKRSYNRLPVRLKF